jgi:hypothetical protein
MKWTLAILALSLWCAFSQTESKTPPGTTAKTVTVKGCIYQGVECFVLKDSKGKQDYSVGRTDKLQIGHAYRITGSVSDVGSCLEGKPILAPRKINEVKLTCQMEGKK